MKYKIKKTNKSKINNKSFSILLLLIFLLFVSVILYDRYSLKKIKDSYDLEVSMNIERKDELIRDYSSYKDILSNILTTDDYKKTISENVIDESLFEKYDYVALYYKTNMCDGKESYPSALSQLRTKIIVSARRYENDKCKTKIRVSFVPVEKGKYDIVPTVIVKKDIIKD